jgi:hypothetical protein
MATRNKPTPTPRKKKTEQRIETTIRIGAETSDDLITAAENKLTRIDGVEKTTKTTFDDLSPRCGGGGTYITIKSTLLLNNGVTVEEVISRIEELIAVDSISTV